MAENIIRSFAYQDRLLLNIDAFAGTGDHAFQPTTPKLPGRCCFTICLLIRIVPFAWDLTAMEPLTTVMVRFLERSSYVASAEDSSARSGECVQISSSASGTQL